MSTSVSFTETAVQRLAPDDDSYKAARDLIRKKSFLKPGISADQTWLLGECKGSGKNPYEISIDITDSSQPTFRCNCPSRKFPCKHGLGLLLHYAQSANQFTTREPSEELQAKREKKAAREQKKTEEGAAPPKPKKVNVAALQKKIAAQREGLDLLEKLVVDLVAGGQWYETNRLDKLDRQAKQLGDAFLNAAMFSVNRLVLVGREAGLSDEERNARASDLIGQLWATVQKGRNYLDEKLSSDENQAEADAVIEDVLGKTWQLTELKEKGYFKADLHLLELAYERFFDAAKDQQIEHSHLVDFNDGAIYQATSLRPRKAMKFTAEQPSYMQPLALAEAAVYPGFLNRRVRWEKTAEKFEEMQPVHLEKAYRAAKPEFKGAIDAFKLQLKHPLAPRDAMLLLRCERIGKVGDRVVLEDSAGLRIEAVDRRTDYSNVANLVRAGGMLNADHPAVLARLFVLPLPNTIVAEPLALLTPKHHLRLGL
jgi:SWIM zinc finger